MTVLPLSPNSDSLAVRVNGVYVSILKETLKRLLVSSPFHIKLWAHTTKDVIWDFSCTLSLFSPLIFWVLRVVKDFGESEESKWKQYYGYIISPSVQLRNNLFFFSFFQDRCKHVALSQRIKEWMRKKFPYCPKWWMDHFQSDIWMSCCLLCSFQLHCFNS